MKHVFSKKIVQILWGVGCIAAALISTYVADGDATGAILMIPLGLYCIFGKDVFDD